MVRNNKREYLPLRERMMFKEISTKERYFPNLPLTLTIFKGKEEMGPSLELDKRYHLRPSLYLGEVRISKSLE